ncbi:hypothetical protein PGRAN_09016 [Listeria grandensis FSL F6-0971]|uniref:Uncharacterized protein n=1 Tax=Listeria grandensis FSL F6-0971 TaxID=1265819 RepID=W7BBB9_9LIST|nr:hypothetical protein [Listeria grandensis]EUJ23302.1 hypothetical protein PGRAN_09016 [Listeria grandensis FSL F6-0971]
MKNDNTQLSMTVTLQPDADKGIEKLVMAVDYKNKETNQKLKFDLTMELVDFEKIPTFPSEKNIVNKQELDALMADINIEQLK